ncbi:MAG: hypothetical protein BWX85_01093 [Chloroflexi bacterium ADurb.Bin120]|uniref:Uncharacterized protein n=1 Tax=Candidatus Brevifilum fermentans TaxID=1986204 RepID=A0A1Y6K6N6_9CHLR|nr:hypothetical protein [Brevefilum fermentans]OQB84013.1 MAG: hypothetical protein BWX85_01093 [Chloroflexi bacterium ADurb.Bin120]SMX55246.1 protein of unknown function [Brevefilum fermentans]
MKARLVFVYGYKFIKQSRLQHSIPEENDLVQPIETASFLNSFISIVAQGRIPPFGEGINGEIHLNPTGELVVQMCEEMSNDITVMPNIFMGVIELHIGNAP